MTTINIVFWLAIALGAVQFYIFFRSLIFWQLTYPKWWRPRFKDAKELPSVHLLIASKGLPNHLEKIIRNFANQDYAGTYKISVITESAQDPGAPLLKSLAEEYDHLRHIVAGRTTQCSQKNYNLLAGMEGDHTSDVFAFADADVHVGRNWLTQLIQPLTMGKNWLSTALPSHSLSQTKLPHIIQCALTTFQSKIIMSFGAIWGGSYAIWRETFDGLNTRELWAKTVVDDISLYQEIQKNNLRHLWGEKNIKLMPIPDLELDSYTSHNSIHQVTNWFVRQVLYIKFHRRAIWHVAVWANFSNLLLMTVLPFGMLFSWDHTFFQVGLIGFLFLLYMQVINLSLPLIRRKTECSMLTWSKMFVWGDMVANLALMSTLFTNRMVWSGITYVVGRNGKVKEVIHPDSLAEPITGEYRSH